MCACTLDATPNVASDTKTKSARSKLLIAAITVLTHNMDATEVAEGLTELWQSLDLAMVSLGGSRQSLSVDA